MTLDSETSVKLQSGEFWELSCSTKLEGEVSDDAVVKNEQVTTTETKDGSSIEFSLDVMCCDPDEAGCKQCGTTDDQIPIIKIGPRSKADSRLGC